MKPTLVLVGRPNVGKSTLFNRLTRSRDAIVADIPGSLSQLTKILADHKANILEVHHDRVKHGLNLKETKIDFVIETTSHEHIQKIREDIQYIKEEAKTLSEQWRKSGIIITAVGGFLGLVANITAVLAIFKIFLNF